MFAHLSLSIISQLFDVKAPSTADLVGFMGVGKPSCCTTAQCPSRESVNTSRQRTPAPDDSISETIELDLLRQELDTLETQLRHLQAQQGLTDNRSLKQHVSLYEQYKAQSTENSNIAAQIYVHFVFFQSACSLSECTLKLLCYHINAE